VRHVACVGEVTNVHRKLWWEVRRKNTAWNK